MLAMIKFGSGVASTCVILCQVRSTVQHIADQAATLPVTTGRLNEEETLYPQYSESTAAPGSTAPGNMRTVEQKSAAGKEKVLAALGEAASQLRGQLGESLATVQKYDASMIEEAMAVSLI